MKLLTFFTVSLLVGLAYTAPTSNGTESSKDDDENIVVTKEFFDDQFAIYTAEHDIVNILLPLNSLNFDDDTDDEESDSSFNTIFFVLADTENGQRVDKGLYIRKKGVVTKLLDNGREASAANDDTKTAYFAASDGIYVYNDKENKAEKYGTLNDDIIGIAKVNGSDVIYILTNDHFIYKVTEEGTKKERVHGIEDAQQIVLDYENNLYYYTSDKKVYVHLPEGCKRIEGLPEQASYVHLLKPPFIIEDGIPIVFDYKTYIGYVNGSSEESDFELQARPTAYSIEATLINYYAYNKKIYEYNVLVLLMSEFLDQLKEVKDLLSSKADEISEIATRSRSDLRA